MVEPWDELLALERESQLCASDVEVIKSTCAKDHRKNHVAECPDCWSRVVNRMRDRYLNSATKGWFSGRRIFLQELDDLFAQVHDHRVDLNTIEQRICEEKKDWFRDKVKIIGLQAATSEASQSKLLQKLLNDPDISTDQLKSEIRGVFREDPAKTEATFNTFMEDLDAAKSSQARALLYNNTFFQPNQNVDAVHCDKYIQMIFDGSTTPEVMSAMLRDRQAIQGSQDERLLLQKKVEELRRAKAAHEASSKAKQAKVDTSVASQPGHEFPPCAVCTNTISLQGFDACPICLVLQQKQYNGLERSPIVFCSAECNEKGFGPHLEQEHVCASGDDCVTATDEDVDMDANGDLLGLCKECVEELEIESVFCSPRCFDENFQKHREQVHLLRRESLGQIVEDENDLEFSSEDKSRYRARKIEEHFVPLDDAVKEYTNKSGAVVS